MTLDSVGNLLIKICVHWPAAKKNFLNQEGKVSKLVAEEWYNRIGFLDDEKVDAMLEEYLLNPEVNKYAPGVPYFLGHRKERKASGFVAGEARMENRYRVKDGILYDQEDRIYADPEDPDGVWYTNAYGYICKKDSENREVVWFR